jgi:glutamine amidotransferase
VIGIVDYGMGNRRSVEKAVERAGAQPLLTGDHDTLRGADGLIVPGVGAFPAAMRALDERGLSDLVRERAADGTPVLGSCLGMQLLFERSTEHEGAQGIGLLPGDVVRLDAGDLKLPHIGWNEVRWRRGAPIAEGLPERAAFYHVHSFVPRPADPDLVIGVSDYGSEFASVVGRDNVVGCQFHPEKSSVRGLALLRNFAAMCARVAT